jgi:hypothetical protein|tara:strand:+ start:219 stop:857 length:639 start_codon:yes stop_codon:yes gene_type:complete
MAQIKTKTLDKFGVPTTSNTGSGILMPKLKFRFRVLFAAGFGDGGDTLSITQNVQNVTRPKVAYEEVVIDSYNSKVYVQGKHTWEPMTIVIRDDIRNTVAKAVGSQNMKQLNHFSQTAPVSGADYKFDMLIEVLDGQTADATESWALEGCFLTQTDYSDSDYATNEPVQITMVIRFDNAIHQDPESGTVVSDAVKGLNPDTLPTYSPGGTTG